MENQESLIAVLAYGIVFISLLLLGLMLFFHYSRKKIVQEQVSKIEMKLYHQKNVLKATIATQEEERTRIAQDLHDDISSKLNIVSLTTNMLLDDTAFSKEHYKSLNHILEVTTTTLESSRKIAHDLLPPILDKFGLEVALEELLDDYIRTNKLQVLYEINRLPLVLKSNELHVFRIVQELINNAIRHANASQVQINLNATDSGFLLKFEDNGVGFDTTDFEEKAGLGIQNIKSRAAILNATLTAESTLGVGSNFILKTNGKDE
ncbi:sensor histidine kinase [Patiriisocius sp. Uisw_017]|jgi:two-component system NarL family sensor kinase|uniref:sensor histidine kinase n=1 Tax=Patiriisocius sp. Uisw_017 TaxID=3230968 RepID=UPI0039EB1F96